MSPVLSTKVNQPASEAYPSLPSSSEVKEWSCISTVPYAVYGRLRREIDAVFTGSNGERKKRFFFGSSPCGILGVRLYESFMRRLVGPVAWGTSRPVQRTAFNFSAAKSVARGPMRCQ